MQPHARAHAALGREASAYGVGELSQEKLGRRYFDYLRGRPLPALNQSPGLYRNDLRRVWNCAWKIRPWTGAVKDAAPRRAHKADGGQRADCGGDGLQARRSRLHWDGRLSRREAVQGDPFAVRAGQVLLLWCPHPGHARWTEEGPLRRRLLGRQRVE